MPDKPPSLDQFDQFDFRELPIGVYMTSIDGQFVVANRIVRMMLELPLDGRLNANIKNYYANPADRDEAIAEAKKLAEQGRNVERGILHLKVGERELYVEDYCKILQNTEDNVIGFVGCWVDITADFESRQHEKELQGRVKELTFDIGRILHSNNTTFVMIDQTLNSTIQALEPNPFGNSAVPLPEEVDEILGDSASHLSNSIERFLQVADEERRLKALPEIDWKSLTEQMNGLRDFRKTIKDIELRPPAWGSSAQTVMQICQGVVSGYLPREVVKDLQQSAWHLKRLALLYDVLKTRDALIQMEYTLQSLREYVTADVRETSKRESYKVRHLIDQAIRRLVGFSQSSGVVIEAKDIVDVEINVNEREVVRALANLLHNAIKYSWRRDRAKPSWVSIRTFIREHKVHVEFENWGVPISKDELDQGLVFELGYRGQWSKDRGRLGTGIGLADVRHIVESHGGEILIDSRPTKILNEKDRDYYNQPFVTKATMVLPIRS